MKSRSRQTQKYGANNIIEFLTSNQFVCYHTLKCRSLRIRRHWTERVTEMKNHLSMEGSMGAGR